MLLVKEKFLSSKQIAGYGLVAIHVLDTLLDRYHTTLVEACRPIPSPVWRGQLYELAPCTTDTRLPSDASCPYSRPGNRCVGMKMSIIDIAFALEER